MALILHRSMASRVPDWECVALPVNETIDRQLTSSGVAGDRIDNCAAAGEIALSPH